MNNQPRVGIFEIYKDTSDGRIVLETLACIDYYSVRLYADMKYGEDFTGVKGNPFSQVEATQFDFRWIGA